MLFICAASAGARAEGPVTLDEARYWAVPGSRARIELVLSAPASVPPNYAIYEPARIVLDLPGVALRLAEKTKTLNTGVVRGITAVEAGGRTRVVVSLVKWMPYQIRAAGRSIQITIGGARAEETPLSGRLGSARMSVADIGFLRTQPGEGQVTIALSEAPSGAAVFRQGREISVELRNMALPQHLARRLDVLDFGTPVTTIDSSTYRGGARVVITTTGRFDYLAYEHDKLLVVEVDAVQPEPETEGYLPAFRYTGWPLQR
jgi:type IV pilus assembly protein PilQ